MERTEKRVLTLDRYEHGVVINALNEMRNDLLEEERPTDMNCTPFVRQCDIMSNKWGDFYAKRGTEKTIHTGIQETGHRNHAKRKTELP